MAYSDRVQLDAALPATLVRLPLPYHAAFMAGRAFSNIAAGAGPVDRPFRISTSAPMRPRKGTRSLPATLPDIVRTSRT